MLAFKVQPMSHDEVQSLREAFDALRLEVQEGMRQQDAKLDTIHQSLLRLACHVEVPGPEGSEG